MANQAELVEQLVQMTVATIDGERRDLADQRQHRRAHAKGGEQGGRGVEQARSGHHRAGLRLAGDQRRAECHVCRGLLMAWVDHADAVTGTLRRVEQVVVVHSGQRVQRIDAVS